MSAVRCWLKTGHKVTMAVRQPTSSKAIELKKQGFGVCEPKLGLSTQ